MLRWFCVFWSNIISSLRFNFLTNQLLKNHPRELASVNEFVQFLDYGLVCINNPKPVCANEIFYNLTRLLIVFT